MVTRLRLTRGRAASGGASSKRTDPLHRARVKDYLSESRCCREPSARPRIFPSPLKKSAHRPDRAIGGGRPRSRGRPRVSPRIVLAHKEAVYQRLLSEAVTHAGPTQIQRPYRTCPSSRVSRGEPLALCSAHTHAWPFISHFRRTGVSSFFCSHKRALDGFLAGVTHLLLRSDVRATRFRPVTVKRLR